MSKINFLFSSKILSNSKQGLVSYRVNSDKTHIIHNGMNIDRFKKLNLPDQIKNKYNVNTKFVVGMVASFSIKKNYSLFFNVAELVTKINNNITFLAIGGPDGADRSMFYYKNKYKNNRNIIITGAIDRDLESVMNICDIGILLTNGKHHGEGISNAILEFFCFVSASDRK